MVPVLQVSTPPPPPTKNLGYGAACQEPMTAGDDEIGDFDSFTYLGATENITAHKSKNKQGGKNVSAFKKVAPSFKVQLLCSARERRYDCSSQM